MAQSRSGRWALSGSRWRWPSGPARLSTLGSRSAAPAGAARRPSAAAPAVAKPAEEDRLRSFRRRRLRAPKPPPAPAPASKEPRGARPLRMTRPDSEETYRDKTSGPAGAPPPAARSAPAAGSPLRLGSQGGLLGRQRPVQLLPGLPGGVRLRCPNHALEIGERISPEDPGLRGQGRAERQGYRQARAPGSWTRGSRTRTGRSGSIPWSTSTTAASNFRCAWSPATGNADLAVDRDGPRRVVVKLDRPRALPAPLALDVLFVLDTTGSMGEEIERLRDTIEIVHANISAMTSRPAVRFGMVLYKDRGDEYVTEVVPFTADLQVFQAALAEVYAAGGGDTPEDLQAALEDSLKKMAWNEGGVRIAFVITDAEPHLDYDQKYTYAQAAKDARARGYGSTRSEPAAWGWRASTSSASWPSSPRANTFS
ncbi:MAG: VWA domain-containing protein [Desulfobacterales bacterium]|nr:VWA domain-containing protein [Desulfobacterales bacterium]